MSEIRNILDKCQNTASWFGLIIESVHDRNDFQDTPLHTVCSWGDIESVRKLIESGADIDAKGDQGATPIFNAINSKNEDLVKYLLQQGASKGSKIFGTISLYEYAKNAKLSKKVIDMLK